MIIHIVTSGDTIYSISKEYSIPATRIITDNFLDPTEKLVPGQTLIISRPCQTCFVRGGDTLDSIAKRNHVSVLSILQNNPRLIEEKLRPSQSINLGYSKENTRQIIIAAYSGSASLSEIEKYLPYISVLTVQNVVKIEKGNVSLLLNTDAIVSLIKKYRALPILSLDCVSERGMWNGECVSNLLASPTYTENFIQNAVKVAKSNGFMGLELSMAGIATKDAYKFADMLLALDGLCKENELICTSPLFPVDGINPSEENVADIASLVPLWSYIWDDTTSAAPAAPYDRIAETLKDPNVRKYKEKILLGLPTFGIAYAGVGNRYQKQPIHASSGIILTQKNHVSAEFNERTRTPYVQYENNGERHIVHYEDARSISEKLDLVDRLGLGGVNIMSLEYDSPVLWQILNQRYSIQKY